MIKLKLKNYVIGIIAVIAIVAIVISCTRSSGDNKNNKRMEVERGDISVSILATGVVQPENRLEIKAPISGRADEVFVDEGKVVKRGELLMTMSSSERAALLDAARARGPAELKRWMELYKAAPIMAPIDGTIILRSVQPGQSFTSQDAVLVMSDRLTVKAQVDETDIAKIRLNQMANVTLDAYSDQKIEARVDKISFEAKTINNVTTYIVDVLPTVPPEYMRSGMTANVSFEVESKVGVLLLPINAIKRDGERRVVTVPGRNALVNAEERDVVLGISDGKKVEVMSGLAEGDAVLLPQANSSKGASGASNPLSPFGAKKR